MQYRRPKLTIDQQAQRKAIRPLARDLKAQIKGDAPRLTGALKSSIDFKIVSKKGWAAAIIGVRSKFYKIVNKKTELKLPNLYALRAGMKDIIKRYVNANSIAKLAAASKEVVKDMLSKGKR